MNIEKNVNEPEKMELYAPRKKIYPKRAEGQFRRLKWIIMAITLSIYYITPWLRWDRGPYAPDQAVLIDIANARFYVFFIEIWPQEFYFVAGLLVMAGVGLFLITSVVGRAWCGYTCPQTVWVDLFLVVERFIEGDRNARMKLEKGPYNFEKLRKRIAKHFVWLVIAVGTGGAWIFYFADAPTLLKDFVNLQAPFVAYATVGILTATTYIFGGHMREQVCNYMCPWPRIQAAMLDESSLVVTYNDWRGEPRTHGSKKAKKAEVTGGDCIDCMACVNVCPAGIDIRDGQQMECITCALCIDACDDIMGKLGREKGLISYSTLEDYNTNMSLATDPDTLNLDPNRIRDETGFIDKIKHFNSRIFLRPRTLLYFALWASLGLGLLTALTLRDRLGVNVQHDRNPQYVQLSNGSIRNTYTVKILNMIQEPRTIILSMEGLAGGSMEINGFDDQEDTTFRIFVDPDKLRELRVFVKQTPDNIKEGSTPFRFIVEDKQSNEQDIYKAVFEAPKPGE